MDQKELKKQGKSLKPFTQIGKNGITEGAVTKINLYLKKHKLGKVKFLESSLDNMTAQVAVQQLAEQTKATIIDQVGGVVVLYKR